ncbi:cell wall elongation regulator TseB-like domain-containing protein [Virgibacillus proomii]|uniref:cell wall elongation regulator TseB-like domain-containing protein n=1 Tax=Virgibacillus proomii TaxID=84407 RepID=UPI0009853FD5|nr:DUF5590 domain-containing protein [Virgibacillus proomii]
MKNKLSSLFTNPKWLKWSLFAIIFIIVSCGIYLTVLYMDLLDSKTAGYEETKQQLLKAGSLKEVTDIETFNGENAYHVVYGKDKKGKNKIIFYPLKGKEKQLTTVDQAEILNKEAILTDWKKECSSCKFIKITPALVDGKELWELTYVDSSGRYVFDYFDMYDGSRYEQYRLKRMFK